MKTGRSYLLCAIEFILLLILLVRNTQLAFHIIYLEIEISFTHRLFVAEILDK